MQIERVWMYGVTHSSAPQADAVFC